MFIKIPLPLKNEYKRYRSEHRMLVISHLALIFLLAVIVPTECWAAVRTFDEVGGLIFQTLEEADHPLSYSALFVSMIVLEITFNRLLKLVRSRQLFQSLHYMEHRFYTLVYNPVTDRASACKNAFGDVMDGFLNYIHTFLLILSLSFFTCYTNYFAGPPLVILFAVGSFITIKKKTQNKWLSLATNAVLQAYFISTILLMVFHKLSYGSILGYYTTIYLKMLFDKDICEDYLHYRTQTERLEPLSMAFEEREPVTEPAAGSAAGSDDSQQEANETGIPESGEPGKTEDIGENAAEEAPEPAEEEKAQEPKEA